MTKTDREFTSQNIIFDEDRKSSSNISSLSLRLLPFFKLFLKGTRRYEYSLVKQVDRNSPWLSLSAYGFGDKIIQVIAMKWTYNQIIVLFESENIGPHFKRRQVMKERNFRSALWRLKKQNENISFCFFIGQISSLKYAFQISRMYDF